MWFELAIAVGLVCVGAHAIFFEEWVGHVAFVGQFILGGICFVEGLVFAVGATLLRLKGRLAWSGQVLIIAFALLGLAFPLWCFR